MTWNQTKEFINGLIQMWTVFAFAPLCNYIKTNALHLGETLNTSTCVDMNTNTNFKYIFCNNLLKRPRHLRISLLDVTFERHFRTSLLEVTPRHHFWNSLWTITFRCYFWTLLLDITFGITLRSNFKTFLSASFCHHFWTAILVATVFTSVSAAIH